MHDSVMERDLAFHKPVDRCDVQGAPRAPLYVEGARGPAQGERAALATKKVSAPVIASRPSRSRRCRVSADREVADDLASHSLVRLLPEYEPPPLPVQLVTTSAQHLAPKVCAFLDHATRSFATLDVIRRWS